MESARMALAMDLTWAGVWLIGIGVEACPGDRRCLVIRVYKARDFTTAQPAAVDANASTGSSPLSCPRFPDYGQVSL